jgi:hypothetical protein
MPGPLEFIRDALDAAQADVDTLLATANGLARHRRRARDQLVLDLLLGETFEDRLAALDAHRELLGQLDDATRLLSERVRVMALLRGTEDGAL